MTQQFQVGQTYATRSICDYDSIYSFTILARTAKQVTVEVRGEIVKRRLRFWDDTEQFHPFGIYSMSPIISADDRSIALARNAR